MRRVVYILTIHGETDRLYMADADNLWYTEYHDLCVQERDRIAPLFPRHRVKVTEVAGPEGQGTEELLRRMLAKWRALTEKRDGPATQRSDDQQ